MLAEIGVAEIGLAVGLGALGLILILACTLTLALLVLYRKSNRSIDDTGKHYAQSTAYGFFFSSNWFHKGV